MPVQPSTAHKQEEKESNQAQPSSVGRSAGWSDYASGLRRQTHPRALDGCAPLTSHAIKVCCTYVGACGHGGVSKAESGPAVRTDIAFGAGEPRQSAHALGTALVAAGTHAAGIALHRTAALRAERGCALAIADAGSAQLQSIAAVAADADAVRSAHRVGLATGAIEGSPACSRILDGATGSFYAD